MPSVDELAGAVPSGSICGSGSGSKTRMPRNNVVVSSALGEVADNDTQPLRAAFEATRVRLEVAVGDEVVVFDDPSAQWSVALGESDLLLALMRGNTPFGSFTKSEPRRLLSFRWPYADVDEIYLGAVRRFGKWWNEEVSITSPAGASFTAMQVDAAAGTSLGGLVRSLASGAVTGIAEAFPAGLVAAVRDATGAEVDRTEDKAGPEWSRTVRFRR